MTRSLRHDVQMSDDSGIEAHGELDAKIDELKQRLSQGREREKDLHKKLNTQRKDNKELERQLRDLEKKRAVALKPQELPIPEDDDRVDRILGEDVSARGSLALNIRGLFLLKEMEMDKGQPCRCAVNDAYSHRCRLCVRAASRAQCPVVLAGKARYHNRSAGVRYRNGTCRG
jgi:hypothetical protein